MWKLARNIQLLSNNFFVHNVPVRVYCTLFDHTNYDHAFVNKETIMRYLQFAYDTHSEAKLFCTFSKISKTFVSTHQNRKRASITQPWHETTIDFTHRHARRWYNWVTKASTYFEVSCRRQREQRRTRTQRLLWTTASRTERSKALFVAS